MKIRLLNSLDAENYRNIRLESLRNSPEAFASSYEDEKDKSIEELKNKFQLKGSFTFRAFEKGELVGPLLYSKKSHIKLVDN
ncbi:hypothetical protein [Ectobacillus polymachus]|uniref:hypothetical protein n=1 Tax=Ectobacillus polymachus TaxID=1508806 RepID=UPI003A87B6C9